MVNVSISEARSATSNRPLYRRATAPVNRSDSSKLAGFSNYGTEHELATIAADKKRERFNRLYPPPT